MIERRDLRAEQAESSGSRAALKRPSGPRFSGRRWKVHVVKTLQGTPVAPTQRRDSPSGWSPSLRAGSTRGPIGRRSGGSAGRSASRSCPLSQRGHRERPRSTPQVGAIARPQRVEYVLCGKRLDRIAAQRRSTRRVARWSARRAASGRRLQNSASTGRRLGSQRRRRFCERWFAGRDRTARKDERLARRLSRPDFKSAGRERRVGPPARCRASDRAPRDGARSRRPGPIRRGRLRSYC